MASPMTLESTRLSAWVVKAFIWTLVWLLTNLSQHNMKIQLVEIVDQLQVVSSSGGSGASGLIKITSCDAALCASGGLTLSSGGASIILLL